MRTIKLLTATITILSTLLCISCEKIKSLADVDFNTNYIVDIPVQLISADAQSSTFAMSLSDIDDLNEYLDKLKGLTISDIELSVLSYQGDDYTGEIELTADGVTLWSRDDVVTSKIKPFKLKSDANLDEDVLEQMAIKLLRNESVKGGLNVNADSSDPITASFTVRCKFILEITANALN